MTEVIEADAGDGLCSKCHRLPPPPPHGYRLLHMYTLHCTKKLLDRLAGEVATTRTAPTTILGNWYATALFRRPQMALLVSERVLLPVLMPLAPAATLQRRLPGELAKVLAAHGMGPAFIEAEVAAMDESSIAKTANRSVVGMLNEFTFLSEAYRERMEIHDPLILAIRLADTPCSPLKGNSPMRLLLQLHRGAVL